MPTHSLLSHILNEKSQLVRIETILDEGNLSEKERRELEELANWHWENCREALKYPGIPWCIQQYVYGYRDEPEPREIQQEFEQRREYFKRNEKLYRRIAFSFAFLAALYIIFKSR